MIIFNEIENWTAVEVKFFMKKINKSILNLVQLNNLEKYNYVISEDCYEKN